MRTLAFLCHFYSGYTLESLRALRVRELNVLIEVMTEALEAKPNG